MTQVCLATSEDAHCPPGSILHICLQSIFKFVFLIVHSVILLCWSILYTRHLLHVCPSSVALPEVSSMFPC